MEVSFDTYPLFPNTPTSHSERGAMTFPQPLVTFSLGSEAPGVQGQHIDGLILSTQYGAMK